MTSDGALREELEKLLCLLPECRCKPAELEASTLYFNIDAADVRRATRELPLNHDLSYAGVRKLLSLCLEEFAELCTDDGRLLCEVSVPAPQCFIYTAGLANRNIRFVSAALFAQLVLRGVFLKRGALDLSSCSKRRCGLNRMRLLLAESPPGRTPDFMLQFSVLCDECAKIGEMMPAAKDCITMNVPKTLPCREKAMEGLQRFIDEMCKATGTHILPEHELYARRLYTRLVRAEACLSTLNARPDRHALYGNSLALAQSVQLMSSVHAEEFIEALEMLNSELENAPPCDSHERVYCFFVPLMQPEIDRRFRENGVSLVGGGAFLYSGAAIERKLPGTVLDWLKTMSIRGGSKAFCKVLSDDMSRFDCSVYMTGAFGFDRWLGALTPLERRLLMELHNIRTVTVDVDFWSENAMFGSIDTRIDGICQTLREGSHKGRTV